MRKEQIITTNNNQMEEKGMKNRFTVYGIRDLGTELSPITMLVMMESIQNMIVENGKRGKATWLYIDEFHVLLNSEYQRHSFDS
jgi:ComB4 competence protein